MTASKKDRLDAALELYKETVSPAWQLYDEILASARQLYEETATPAWKLYVETKAKIEAEP